MYGFDVYSVRRNEESGRACLELQSYIAMGGA